MGHTEDLHHTADHTAGSANFYRPGYYRAFATSVLVGFRPIEHMHEVLDWLEEEALRSDETCQGVDLLFMLDNVKLAKAYSSHEQF